MVGDLTSEQPVKGRRALRRIVLLGLLLVMLVLAGSAALLAFAGRSVDQIQAREERTLVARTMERFQERVVADITTTTVWDQAYYILRPGGDVAWADSEIGSYYANNRGHHVTLAIDDQNRPFYAWKGKARVDANSLATFERDAMPVIDKVRAKELHGHEHERTVDLGVSDPGLAHTAGGLVRSEGILYLVGVSNVVRESADAPHEDGPGILVISAQRVDSMLPRLNEQLRVTKAHVVPAVGKGENSIPLVDASGKTISFLAWEAQRPGMAALQQALPVVAISLLILLGIGALLALHVRHIARELDAEELGHRDAVRALIKARDRAEDANMAKSHFLANMSHEIRTPLNGVLGMVQVMERSGLDGPNAERLEIIRHSGETLLTVLNGILDLSKIEAGRFELDIREFDLSEMVEAACQPFANLAAQKDLEFHIDIHHDALGIWQGDPMRLRQVLSNLAANAVKFTTEGEVCVEVERTIKGLRFCVRDTGMGIPSDRVSALFEKFVQADSSMSRRFGGTGLGLAICREFVDIMGGRLAVQTQEGHGSTFAFELPLPRLRDADPHAVTPTPKVSEVMPLRILAAEDSKPNQLVLKALLEPLGAELHIVSDGKEAVKAYQNGDFDLVLMDIQMPHMNGIDATRAIRKAEQKQRRSPTPIIALSANVMGEQIRDYMAAGMDGYVAKPIDATALIDAIQQALEPRSKVAAL
jgi:signal transduction histidine kinase/CheY-like chemotaxis protein